MKKILYLFFIFCNFLNSSNKIIKNKKLELKKNFNFETKEDSEKKIIEEIFNSCNEKDKIKKNFQNSGEDFCFDLENKSLKQENKKRRKMGFDLKDFEESINFGSKKKFLN